MSSAARTDILLKGTHGTSKSRAHEIITKERFEASKEGLLGAGAYFWAFADDVSFALRLASNWWRFASVKLNAYRDDTDNSLAVLKAQIEVDQNVYFDASSDSFLELLVKTAEEKKIESSKNDFNKLRAVLLKEIEALQGFNFGVLKAVVEVPGAIKGADGAPFVYWATKQAASYVVMPHALNLVSNIELVGV